MKSENENIEEIENLIRNNSEQEEYSIQDGDWEQLQMMMNQDARRKKIGWIWKGAIELIVIGAWFLSMNNDYKVSIEIEEAINTIESEMVLENEMKAVTNANLVANSRGTELNTAKRNLETTFQVKGQAFSVSDNKTRTEIAGKLTGESERGLGRLDEMVSVVTSEDTNQFNAAVVEENDRMLFEELSLNPKDRKKEEKNKPEVAEFGDVDSIVSPPLVPQAEFELLTEDGNTEPLAIDALDSTTVSEKTESRKVHFYVGIGTEWSIAPKSPAGAVQLKLQIGAEYQFTKKWSVRSGLNYTVKEYQTNVEDYVVQPGFWTSGIKPNSILAKCTVVEIPLNLRYYFNNQDARRNSFYLTAGASSYLMASERYSFAYDVADPSLKQEWNGNWVNAHYFSVLHLSAGYQKNFQRNGSILLEPYVDVPLTGIGFGQVDFMSFGLSLQFKY